VRKCQFIACFAIVLLLTVFLTSAGCAPDRDFDRQLKDITGSYRFTIATWEIGTLAGELWKVVSGEYRGAGVSVEEVGDYFDIVEEIRQLKSGVTVVKMGIRDGDTDSLEDKLAELEERKAAATDDIERLLEVQIREALSREDIYSPAYRYTGLPVGFPPVNFELGNPPRLLVVSPRDRIESLREVTLLPDMTVEEMETIEAAVEELGYSALVVNLGGMATFPSYVTDSASLRFVLNTAAEEWLHQYLAFTPLGFSYVLDLAGIRRDYEIATMNETVAGIVSKEIGALVYEEYYALEDTGDPAPAPAGTGFDFNREMRETRKAVDAYLAAGEIEQAEQYMEERRRYLAENGYVIRKLNQAYFAFHGAYADSPTSISPIGV